MNDSHIAEVLVKTASACAASCRSHEPVVLTANTGPRTERTILVRRAFRLEFITIAWMVVEAGVSLWGGARADSVSLRAFGIDSLIEIISAGVLIWRLVVELRHGQVFAERAERTASRITGGLLFGLAAYVVIAAALKFVAHTGEVFSLPGLIITMLAMPIMYFLASRKIVIAEALGSRAMRADAMESVTCGYLSLVVVVGLTMQALTGAWWVDAATSLGVVWFLVKEGREAWTGDCSC
ncbi:cation transporter [Acidiphilium multivorum]|uniref:cation transporter n=1 Tax=Acidiphilium multivorum TaxID=62140 RepID=UPI001B8CFEBE|nr:cation transporter [Acidiphilium multivorum]MBS3025021.1 cation transporter [Acidiphilium multivorum]